VDEARDITEIWAGTLASLVKSGELSGHRYGYVSLVKPLALVGDTALLAVGFQHAKDFLENQVAEALKRALTETCGHEVGFAITVDPTLEEQGDSAEEEPLDVYAASPPEPLAPGERDSSRILPRYTFENFVIGPSNRFAHAAAVAVAEAPAKAYNPLFIYGGSGLGKTHLLHAIGNYARDLFPGIRVRYTTSDEFTNQFINCVRDGEMEEFRRLHRGNDILLIDDIQFLKTRDRTMEEFFHTFNALHNSGSQVVITSDLPPKQLVGFEDRMRSRFEWGLLTDVQPPDLETRIAILRKKADSEGISAPDDVMEYIASRISSNIRELEGSLIRVTAFASLNQQPVDLALAEIVLRDLITDHPAEITSATIIGQTAQYFAISIEDLCGPSRSRQLVNARQIAMYLCRELTELSLPAIGREFGGRDHTTVMHAQKKVKEQLAEKRAVFIRVTELTNRIKQQTTDG